MFGIPCQLYLLLLPVLAYSWGKLTLTEGRSGTTPEENSYSASMKYSVQDYLPTTNDVSLNHQLTQNM